MSKILRLVKHTATSFASLLVQLFQMVLLKLSYEFKGTFSVVFLGLHRKPVCLSLCFFSYRLHVWHYGGGLFLQTWLAFVFLSYFLILSLVLPFSYFASVLEVSGSRYVRDICVIVKIPMLIFYQKIVEDRSLSCFSELFCVIVWNLNFSVTAKVWTTFLNLSGHFALKA